MTEQNSGYISKEDEDLADLFRRASRLMVRYGHKSCKAPHAQYHVLALIRERGPLTQGELLELLDVRSSSLSEILQKLEATGYIRRRRNEADRRGFILSINEDGPEDIQAVLLDGEKSPLTIFDCLDAEEQQQLRALLGKIINHLGQEPMTGRGARKGVRSKEDCGYGQDGRRGRHRRLVDQQIRGWGRRKK